MSEIENRNAPASGGGRADYRDAAAGARLAFEGAAGRDLRTRPIPFNGLLTNKLLAELPGADFTRLLPHLEPVSLDAEQVLYKFGEPLDFAYFPETAIISHLYFLEDGSSTCAAIVGREGMVGLSTIYGSQPPTYWTRVSVGGSALRVHTEVVKQEFARGGALHELLLGYTGERLAHLSQRAVCNGRHKVDERLCTWLLMLSDRAADDSLPLTQEDIAHHLGTRRASVSTSCFALREAGIIAYSRGTIRVLDRPRLEDAACECYRTLRKLMERPAGRN